MSSMDYRHVASYLQYSYLYSLVYRYYICLKAQCSCYCKKTCRNLSTKKYFAYLGTVLCLCFN